MAFFIVLVVLVLPPVMLVLHRLFETARVGFDLLAVLAAMLAFIESAWAILDIHRDDAVMTTEIHGLFNSIWFLTASGYLALYGIYRLWAGTLERYRQT